MIDRALALVADLERIPDVIRVHATAGLPDLGVPRESGANRIVLTGLGSSRFAAMAVAPVLRSAGLEVLVELASAANPAATGPGTLVVAISSSGRTPETVAAAERSRATGATVVAITNRPGSPLAGAASTVILLEAGNESSGVASATYAATVAALVRLAGALGAEADAERLLADASSAAAQALRDRDGWLSSAADILDGGAPIHVLAEAAALGTAEQAALLFRECPRLDADATDAGDWFHVGIYTALPGYRAILLSGTRYDAELVEVIHGRGGRVVAIGAGFPAADLDIVLPAPALPNPLVRALVEPLVTSSLAGELWRQARAADR